jgi:RNA polymerase primary sigma factor
VFKRAKAHSKKDPSMFEVLISAGNEGLLAGLQKYKPDMGYRFLTYAGWWVDQRILMEMASQRLVKLPIWRQQLSARIDKVVEANEGITFDELKEHFSEVSDKDLRELYETKFLTFYIEDLGDDPGFEINPIETTINTKLDQEKIHEIIESLSSPHREIIQMSFGIVDGEEVKPHDICKQLKLTKAQFKVFKKEALEMLKEIFGDTNPFT